eukprot:6978290-Prymnesium_polylepis.1
MKTLKSPKPTPEAYGGSCRLNTPPPEAVGPPPPATRVESFRWPTRHIFVSPAPRYQFGPKGGCR